MTVERKNNRVLFNGQETSYKALEKFLRRTLTRRAGQGFEE